MEAHKRFGRWEDNLTVALQLLIYGFAYNAPAGAPLIWFTVNAYICLITAIILSAVVTTVFQAFFWELLKVAKIEVSELVKLLCANLGKWLVPCFLFVAIAKYSPENASYSSLSFVLLSGILLAAINTFLVAAFSQREGKGALVNVCCLGMSVLLLIATISATNYELLSQAFLKAKVTCLEMAAPASLESARYQDAVNLLDESLKVSPSTASTYNLRACAYQSLNKDREAIADCDKSIELKTGSKHIRYTRFLLRAAWRQESLKCVTTTKRLNSIQETPFFIYTGRELARKTETSPQPSPTERKQSYLAICWIHLWRGNSSSEKEGR